MAAMPRIVTLLAFVLLAACGSKAPATTTTDSARGGEPTEVSTQVGTLRSLENGDRACYVGLQLDDGTEVAMEGDFALCAEGDKDATALIGQRVTYTTDKANVRAAECQGDMDCGKSDEVDLVISLTTAP